MVAGAFLLSLAASAAAAASPVVEPAPAGATSWTAAGEENFLLTAKVVRSEPVSGVEGAFRVTLSDGKSTRDALARTVEAYNYRWAAIRDSYRYNVAAYRLDRMLGLGAVPVTVEREIGGRMASVTPWVEDTAGPREGAAVAAFRQLVYAPAEGAPNLPDVVSNSDYTQAFALCDELLDGRNLAPVSSEFLGRLRALDRRELSSQLASLLSKREIECLWSRRHEILERSAHASARAAAESSSSATN
jgi:hypothetical protein